MAECDGAAVYVDAAPIPAECLAVGERLHGERFVCLDEIIIVDGCIGACQQIPYRHNRRKKQVLWFSTTGRISGDSCKRSEVMSFRERERRHDERAGAVV